jgi:hypothetical protein
MFANVAITREWMTSGIAQRAYLVAAIGSITFLLIAFLAKRSAIGHDGGSSVSFGLLSVVLLVCSLCVATLTYAMLYFAYRFDTGGPTGRTIWIVFFLLLPPLPQIIYYWSVYRRSKALAQK